MTDTSAVHQDQPQAPQPLRPAFTRGSGETLSSIQNDMRECARNMLNHKKRLETLAAQIGTQAEEILRTLGA